MTKKLITILLFFAIIAVVFTYKYFVLIYNPSSKKASDYIPPTSKLIKAKGQVFCLPFKIDVVQTKECLLGIKTENGKVYALKNLQEDFSVAGLNIEIEGIYRPEEKIQTIYANYDIDDVIEVKSAKTIKNLNITLTSTPPTTITPTTTLSTNTQPQIINKSLPILTVYELMTKAENYLGKQIAVKDVVDLSVNCLMIEPPDPNTCYTKVQLKPNPLGPNYLQIVCGDKNVSCEGSPINCKGFERNKVYTVQGIFIRCGYKNLHYCLDLSGVKTPINSDICN